MQNTNLAMPVIGGLKSSIVSADAAVSIRPGNLVGIFVTKASSSPKITFYDNTAGSGTVLVNEFTPVDATWYPLPFPFRTGLYADISGSVEFTVAIS